MNYKKVLIILFAILFFLTALTSYVNRVVFPLLIKKIAIERIEDTLKRKIEIGTIHFNWFRGIIIDKIKIYENAPSNAVFAQADQVSFGIIFFPGLKHSRITIPYINVRSPSVHLIRTGQDNWNFSDIFAPAPATSRMAPAKPEKTTALEIAWGGISINDGKLLVNDISTPRKWSEFFDNINLKLSLSYKGISYDFTADIPGKKGSVGATVYYQPITKDTQAQIHLKNIDTASYLSLVNTSDVRLNSGTIKEIDLNIKYSHDETSAQGDVIMKNLDIVSQDQNFKGDIEIHHLNAQYQNGGITVSGQMALNKIQTHVPGLFASGSVQASVNAFEMSPKEMKFNGSLDAQNILLNLKDREIRSQNVVLDNIRMKKDKDGIQSVGSIDTRGLFVGWSDQRIQGDIALKGVAMRMKNENDISIEGELQANDFSTSINGKAFSSRHILLEDAQMNIMEQKNVSINTKLSLDDMKLVFGKNTLTSGSLQTNNLSFILDDGNMRISSTLSASTAKLTLDNHKAIEADPQLELNLQMPLNKPQELIYKGSITLSDGHILGFTPFQSLDNIELDADFQNDGATINALSVNILDTNLRLTGTVKDFKDPFLNVVADADELNLAKIKDLCPRLVNQYGLTFDGSSFVKVQFQGLASDPLAAKIRAIASVKNVSISSSKFHQRIKNITGIIEATPDSLEWRDFTATFLGKRFSFVGRLDDFKNPKIVTTIDGPDFHLNADLFKHRDLVTINSLTGKYSNADFSSNGNISLTGNGPEFNISTNVFMTLEDLVKTLPLEQKKALQPLNPTGILSLSSKIYGTSFNWKNIRLDAIVTSPIVRLSGYRLTDLKIDLEENDGKIKNLTLDGKLYSGFVHAVGSMDLSAQGMPYDLALNIDSTDLHQLKMDSPLKMQEIDGKFYFTTIVHGKVTDFKNNLRATGSMAIRDGYLGEFNLFKGLLSMLNDVMRLSQVMITDVEANFTIDDQKINTDNLRLKGPTIVLLGKGWINFNQMCDLNISVDLSSGVVPAIAHDVLKSLKIRIYDKISDPKFKRKISVPQVLNTLLKNLLQ